MENGERRGCIAPLRAGGFDEESGSEESDEEGAGWGTSLRAMTVRK